PSAAGAGLRGVGDPGAGTLCPRRDRPAARRRGQCRNREDAASRRGAAAAEASGLEVVAARGGELERGVAFGVGRQLFEPLLARASGADRADLMTGAAALARPLFDESQLAPGPEGPAGTSFAMLHGLYWLLAGG